MTTDAKRPIYPQPGPEYDQATFIRLIELLRLKDQATPYTPVSTGWQISNYSETRTFDASTATLSDVNNVLATLLQDLKDTGFLG